MDSRQVDYNPEPFNPQKKSKQKGGKKKIVLLVLAMILVIAVVAVYFVYFYNSGGPLSPAYNLSNTTGLNSQQKLLFNDLARAKSTRGIRITYLEWNMSQQSLINSNITYRTIAAMLPNSTIKLSGTDVQTLKAYTLGNDSKAIWSRNATLTYVGGNDAGQIAGENFTTLVYYNIYNDSNSTVLICTHNFIEVTGISNSSLSCSQGYGANTGLAIFPFTLTNVSWLGYMTKLSNFAYHGTKTIVGRSCDDFKVSNLTSSNQLNYTFEICVDKSYGVPLYYNSTGYENGTVNSTVQYLATNISQNISSEDFVIPPSLLNTTS